MKKILLAFAFLFAVAPAFASAASAPTVSYVGPSTVSAGDTVYVYGTNFDSATFVGLDGASGGAVQPTSITIISPTSLSFVVPSSLSAGNHTIGVAEKAGPWDLSPSVNLTVIPKPQAPAISYITPTTARAGDTVNVYGTNFTTATFVAMYGNNTVLNATYLSPTKLSFVVPSSLDTGEYTLGVAEKAGPWDLGSAAKLTIGSTAQAPTISYISPMSAKIGDTITIYGSNLSYNIVVLDGTELSTYMTTYGSQSNGNMLTFTVPANTTAGSHTVQIEQRIVGGLSNSATLTVTAPVNTPTVSTSPSISSISPVSAKVGDTVTVYGSNLYGNGVVLDGTNLSSYVTNYGFPNTSGNSITFTIPSATTVGAHSVQIEQRIVGTRSNSTTLYVVSSGNMPTVNTTNGNTSNQSDNPPAGNSTCIMFASDLGYRSRDTFTEGNVSVLQDFLQFQGYLNSEPTGFFGLLTTEAAKSFQRSNGINPTGYVGPITRAKIQQLTCGR